MGDRTENEDSMAFWHFTKGKKRKTMAVICDGIGGLEKGEEASSYVVRQLTNWFMTEGYLLSVRKQEKKLQQLCFQIHEEMKSFGKEMGICLGTTMTCVLLDERKMLWAHCGDCRLYLLGKRKSKILTRKDQNEKGHLTRALGVGEWHLLEIKKRRVRQKDKLLLCSDGFYGCLKEKEWRFLGKQQISGDEQAERILKQLWEKKQTITGKDNASALYFGITTKTEDSSK